MGIMADSTAFVEDAPINATFSKDAAPPHEYFEPRIQQGISTVQLDATASTPPLPPSKPIFTPAPPPIAPASTHTFEASLSSSSGEPSHALRHKTSQTWHHSGQTQQAASPRLASVPSPGGRARQNSSPIYPISLNLIPGSSMASAVSESKATSLVRRVSQKAANKFRRRTSSTNNDHDERTGPVLMRHRSGSQSGDQARLGIQHHDDDDDDECAIDDQLDGGQDEGYSTSSSIRGRSFGASNQARSNPSDGIAVPEELQKGTALTRVTRKKKTMRVFKLDVGSAKVSWDPTKQSSRFYIDDMKDVRTGANARNYREELLVSSDQEDRWITIIYMDHEQNGKLKLLHVIAPTAEMFKLWTSTLEAINRYRTEMMAGLAMQGEKFVDAHWRNYMANLQTAAAAAKVDRVSFADVERLCRDIQVNCSTRSLKEKFKRVDRDNSGYLTFQEFEKLVELLREDTKTALQVEKSADSLWRVCMANMQVSVAQAPKAERLSFADVERLCRGIHVNCSREFLRKKFRKADKDNSGYLNFQEFEKFVQLIKEREEIETIWKGITKSPEAGMVRDEFRAFLRDVQKVDVEADSAQVDKVFKKFCRQSSKMGNVAGSSLPTDPSEMRMNREAFTSFLLSSSHNPPLLTSTANQNLNRPINEYYCSSSHNTYLVGRQVAGESSVEGYIRVLQRGCRCVEIDLWDGDNGRPIVTHGHTRTTHCYFSDVVTAIRKYAFIASPYPVILSLEVHCSLEQQITVAEILVDILGDKLVVEPFMTNSMVLPSPQELKHRILVKVKGGARQEPAVKYAKILWRNYMAKLQASSTAKGDCLSFTDVDSLCRDANIDCPTKILEETFRRVNQDNSKHLNYQDFGKFIEFLKEREEIKAAMQDKSADALWRTFMANLQASRAQPAKAERLSFANVESLCREAKINCPRQTFEETFKRIDLDDSGYLNYQRFERFHELIIGDRLSFEDVENLCQGINVSCPTKVLKERFKRVNRDDTGYLRFQDFEKLIEQIRREDIKAVAEGITENPSVGRGSGFLRTNTSSSTSSNTSETDEQSAPGEDRKAKKPTTKIAPELGVLGVYFRGQKFRNFALPESKTYNHVFSFQEKTFLKFCKDPEKKAQLEKHNNRYLMRVYPSGFRVNSSNFDPLGFWRRGVQMVALNWQTYDLGVQLNEAMFASADDKSGYVLKPKALRGPRSTFDDTTAAKQKKDKKQVTFSIEVISAQQLSRPVGHKADDSIDPFVEVEVFSADDKVKGASSGEGGIDVAASKGVSGLGAPQKRRTKTVRDDGFHPLFKEKMTFSLVTKFEDLVFVRFSVYNAEGGDDKTLIATYTAKLISLQQGYRHLPLYNIQGEQYLFSRLFVKIDVEPATLIDRDFAPHVSTIDSIKSTAKSVLAFAAERRSITRMRNDKDKKQELQSGVLPGRAPQLPQEDNRPNFSAEHRRSF